MTSLIFYNYFNELYYSILCFIGLLMLIMGLLIVYTKSSVHSILYLMIIFLYMTEITLILKMEFLALIFIISSCASTKKEDRTEFRRGVASGCAQSMQRKGNTKSDTEVFCDCFANVIVNDMSDDEYRKSVLNPKDEKILLGVMIMNMERLKGCEALTPQAKF